MKEIAGDEGMTLCRSLLDGIEDDGDADLQGRIIEGRCTGKNRNRKGIGSLSCTCYCHTLFLTTYEFYAIVGSSVTLSFLSLYVVRYLIFFMSLLM